LVEYSISVLGQATSPAHELFDYVGVPGQEQSTLDSVRYPSPEGWKTISLVDFEEFWDGIDTQAIFPASRTKNFTQAQKKERLFVYVVVVILRETKLLTVFNEPAASAKERSKLKCPLRYDYATVGIKLKKRAIFDDNDDDDDNHGDKMADVAPTTELSLKNAISLLHNYVQTVQDCPVNILDKLFDYLKLTLLPTRIWFPTPAGWKAKTSEDYDLVFGDMSLSDQLDSDLTSDEVSRSFCEKMEIGMAYLAVRELHEHGYLNDAYQPCLTRAAAIHHFYYGLKAVHRTTVRP